MGLNEIFDDESSDLTKMLDPSMNAGMMNVRESFCVSKIAHEMVFNVDEAGTKAAAASCMYQNYFEIALRTVEYKIIQLF